MGPAGEIGLWIDVVGSDVVEQLLMMVGCDYCETIDVDVVVVVAIDVAAAVAVVVAVGVAAADAARHSAEALH